MLRSFKFRKIKISKHHLIVTWIFLANTRLGSFVYFEYISDTVFSDVLEVRSWFSQLLMPLWKSYTVIIIIITNDHFVPNAEEWLFLGFMNITLLFWFTLTALISVIFSCSRQLFSAKKSSNAVQYQTGDTQSQQSDGEHMGYLAAKEPDIFF